MIEFIADLINDFIEAHLGLVRAFEVLTALLKVFKGTSVFFEPFDGSLGEVAWHFVDVLDTVNFKFGNKVVSEACQGHRVLVY